MPLNDPTYWSDLLSRTLARYDEPLLYQVAGRLFKPRNQWPPDVVLERSLATIGNAPVIDRRLKDLGPAERRLLALIGHSRQPRWKLVHLLEMLATLGHSEGVQPVCNLFQAGLMYPLLPEGMARLRNFEQWLGQGSVSEYWVFAHPFVTERALGEDLFLPELSGATSRVTSIGEADGLEWLLRLAVLWQQVAQAPLRRTQNEDFFKRDLDRLRTDPLLNAPPADTLAQIPDLSLLAVALAVKGGLLNDVDGELRVGTLPAAWNEDLPHALVPLWSTLPHLENWNPKDGWCVPPPLTGNPYPSINLLALLLLARLPEMRWIRPAAVEQWLLEHHPHWQGRGANKETRRQGDRETEKAYAVSTTVLHTGVRAFLLGFAFQLRLLQAARDGENEWVVRLSPLGRWILGVGAAPPALPSFPKTLLVQPNLEILAYRQGLTPELLGRLTRFASWKNLGSACTLQLQPDTVYRALEAGDTFESILQTLERHGMKATPVPVIESLKTWANKHERIGIYPAAVLLEFSSPEYLDEALARGLAAVRLSDRLAVVAKESEVNFQLFRLTGTRDYSLPPEKCVDVETDGVTLTIDLARSDLLLETEVQRFAEPVQVTASKESVNGRRQYRLTPASLTSGRQTGLSLGNLESWFVQRTGQPLSAAARLLLTGYELPPPELRRLHILNVPTKEMADGLIQWPGTRALILERLGPTALVVTEENADVLRERLKTLGMTIRTG
jgi:hypothetical protein